MILPGYIICSSIIFCFVYRFVTKPSPLSWRMVLLFRPFFILLVGGYIMLALQFPLWGAWQWDLPPFQAAVFGDILHFLAIAGYFLAYLYLSHRITRIPSGFGAYLLQHGYFWLMIFNLLVFLRLEYFYLPLIMSNYLMDGTILEIILALVFLGFQGLALYLRRLRTFPAPPEIIALVRETARKMGIRTPKCRIWRMEGVRNAYAMGFLKRRILLTVSLANYATPAELQMIVGHECAHFRRRHLEARIIVILLLFFLGTSLLEQWPEWTWAVVGLFGPVAFLLFQALSRRQELKADALAAQKLGGAERMATALVHSFGGSMVSNHMRGITRFLVGHPDLATRIRHLQKMEQKR